MTDITGSSVVIIEAAEFFQQLGYNVYVGYVKLGEPMAALLQKSGIHSFEIREMVDPGDFDIIWCQHMTFGIIDLESYVGRPLPAKIIFTHLSPFVPLELPTYSLEKAIASAILCNSEETRDSIVRIQGKTGKEVVFSNASPSAYKKAQRDRSELVRVLMVSNHHVPELVDAAGHMRDHYNLHVEPIGVHTGVYRPVTPDDIAWADAIITIGKSVVYGLLGGLPIFVYGPHGGDGYISADNYERNRVHNFSGRPCRTKKTGMQIADEIVGEWQSSLDFIADIQQDLDRDYSLDICLNKLINEIGVDRPIYVQEEWIFQHKLYTNILKSTMIL